MTENLTYGDLRKLLLNLGFEDHSGEFLVYQHPQVRAALLQMAFHEPAEPLLKRDLSGARTLLDLCGLMERDSFDEWARDQKSQKAVS
jgi:hypothetical protein